MSFQRSDQYQYPEQGDSPEIPRPFSCLVDTYRADFAKYLAKISKQDRDQFTGAIRSAVHRKEMRHGADDALDLFDGSPSTASTDIQAYLERLEEIFLHPDEKTRNRRMKLFKEQVLYPFFLVKLEHFPENPFEHASVDARNRGMGEISISEEDRRQEIAATKERQKISLDRWIDYLASDDCKYPSDIKYFAMQGVLAMGTLRDGVVRKRNRSTTAELPQLDSQALSTVLGALEAVYYDKDTLLYTPQLLELIQKREPFGSMYVCAMHALEAQAGAKPLEITEGRWVRYEKGTRPSLLVESLNKGKYRHYLCIGDIGSATQYLDRGFVDVYFSNDRNGNPVVPRIALAISEEGQLYEVRGTFDVHENMDPEISQTDILQTKVKDIPNGSSYLYRDACMKKLTSVYDKCFLHDKKDQKPHYFDPKLSKDDLLFLYEMEDSIEGFGYNKDPRIAEIRSHRKPEQDMLIIFDCKASEIAHTRKDITKNTKAYVGPLQESFFDALPASLEHIYTSFPEGRIRLSSLEIGSLTGQELEQALKKEKINISDYAGSMLKKMKGAAAEQLDLVHLHVADLGFPGGATTKEIFERAKTYGLELCPPETGPYQRLKDRDQPLNDWYSIGMEPVADSDGGPDVFYCRRSDDGLWLSYYWARPGNWWDPERTFLFRRRKSNT